MADDASRLIAADLDGLPEMKVELLDGDLFIGGVAFGHGNHARVLLDLLRTPPDDDGFPSPRQRGRIRVLGVTAQVDAAHNAAVPISGDELDRKFDAGEDIEAYLDWTHARRPNREGLVHFTVHDTEPPDRPIVGVPMQHGAVFGYLTAGAHGHGRVQVVLTRDGGAIDLRALTRPEDP